MQLQLDFSFWPRTESKTISSLLIPSPETAIFGRGGKQISALFLFPQSSLIGYIAPHTTVMGNCMETLPFAFFTITSVSTA
jgi:hypothetical protein